MSKQEKVLKRLRGVLQNALDTSPWPGDYYIEIAKPQARGLLRQINNALKLRSPQSAPPKGAE